MPIRNLDKLLNPTSVAVIGASDDPASVGYGVLRNLLATTSERPVFPVNPRHSSIQGQRAYAQVADLPVVPDLAVVCTPADVVSRVVQECGEAGTRGILVLSAGFAELGEAGRQRDAALRSVLAQYPGMRLIGPNCLGLIVPRLQLNASFAATTPLDGQIAFVSQSGALCTAILDWASERGIGFSHFLSVGNMLDVSFADLIDYFGQDPQTKAVLLYVESIPDARAFLSAARACTRTMPIIVCKAGRSREATKAILSHTGRMAGEDAVFEAAMARAGVVRVRDVDDLFDAAEILSHFHLPAGPRLAIITNAGGPGILAADALAGRGGTLATLSTATWSRLNTSLPPQWSRGNPVDVLGDAPPERYRDALNAVLADPGVDAAVVLLTPQAMTDVTGTARIVSELAASSKKPVLTSWMGGTLVRESRRLFAEAGLPTYGTPERAVNAFLTLTAYRHGQELLYETPRMPLEHFVPDTQLRTSLLIRSGLDQQRILSPKTCEGLLSAYGIPVARSRLARTEEDAVEAARDFRGPCVLKLVSPQISHKSDVDGVQLNLLGDEAVRDAYRRILSTAASRRPDAILEGVLVQSMYSGKGIELILGARRDACFGAVVMVGAGGIMAECLGDSVLELPPLNERLARRMLERLKIFPLLRGDRGQPGVDLDRLVDVIVRFSWLIADAPELLEFEINPLLVRGGEFTALDVRGARDEGSTPAPRPFSHLAIHPYPLDFTASRSLRDGTPVRFRPIRPEDEPRWHELLATCSPESIRSRFGLLFKDMTHEAATRFCFPDYDREMAIVAEIHGGDHARLVGLGQLIADADHESAEFAILVGDPWQEQGLGLALSEFCIETARTWGLKTITAVTDLTNVRMLNAFRELGFVLSNGPSGSQVTVARGLE